MSDGYDEENYNDDDSVFQTMDEFPQVDPYEQTGEYGFIEHPQPEAQGSVISTSQAINLTCTLASLSFLFALFLCFADQRSHAVRRYAVQSAGLGILHIALGMFCWILGALLGLVPLVGPLFVVLFIIAFVAATAGVLALRVKLMLHAYRGVAYALPVVGERLRKFE